MLDKRISGQSEANRPSDPTVRLIEPSSRPPGTAVERLAVAALRHGGAISLSSLVEQIARALYSEELADGGSVLDIGLLGVNLFVRDVAFELTEGNDGLWHIEA